jgi:glyoxylase-like metal-dependent hydrolase (beta-lactamase superfamily II)
MLQAELADPNSLESRTLGLLRRLGLLELVDADRDLFDGARLIHAPGETPGHLILRVHSNGETAYCAGDLVHHPAEIERGWVVNWADAEAKRRSRAALAESATAEKALILTTHIPRAGRLRREGAGLAWDPA